MKKHLFFAFAFVASAIAFTACDKNNPGGPGNYDAKDYAGTKWRIDSCLENGTAVHGPHFFIDVKTDKEVILNGYDTTIYAINGDVMTIHPDDEEPWEVKILKATKDYAELQAQFGTLFYLSRIPEMEGAKLTPSMQNICGQWKWDWYYTEIYHWVYDWEKWYTDYTIGTTAGVETWEFRADGKLVQTNTMDAMWESEPRVLWWAFSESSKQIAWGYEETRPEEIPDSYWMSVELTDHVMHFKKYEPSQHDEGYQDHRWYFSR